MVNRIRHPHCQMWLLLLIPLTVGQVLQSDLQQSGTQQLDGAGGEHRRYTQYIGNLVAHGSEFADSTISDTTQSQGKTINLHQYFPFYGGRYNYTVISTDGYISFGYFSEQTNTFKVGVEVDWPTHADPALIAPYLCRQRISGNSRQKSEVLYRIEKRSAGGGNYFNMNNRPFCRGQEHTFCDSRSNMFLEAMEKALQEGVVGAGVFRADAALVVTWKEMRPNIGDEDRRATYQLVWVTDQQGHLSYSMINYDFLNYDAADMNGNSRTGRCQALFNGGNHTGTVQVDMSDQTKERPSSLAERSAIPHVVRGRYVHRVDDVVRHAGCSNKTGGTYPLLVYPNIVNMLGQVTVDVNALCLDPTITYTLMIEQRQSAPCVVLNPAIARCRLPKILDWGTKTVYFQPQTAMANDERAFVGFLYFVPPTFDPTRLDIGNVNEWYKNPVHSPVTVKWHPRNFTNINENVENNRNLNYFDNSVYNVNLGLYVVGYKEAQDEEKRKFVPKHRVLAKLASFSNRADDEYRWKAQVERVDLTRVESWMLSRYEIEHELFTYRFGYLKLAPVPLHGDHPVGEEGIELDLPEGIISAPISLHWMWTIPVDGYSHGYRGSVDDKHGKQEFVKETARGMCKEWYEEDGALYNFIRETETNASCPCREEQAAFDYGRFMPHPRCSKLFRDVTCTETLGSSNCYISAQNVRGSRVGKDKYGNEHESSYTTHYGQTCCYDGRGYLMQSAYQPVIKIDDSTPYSPGFPTRAYEHGTPPDIGMFEVPGLSTFHHDILPYYLCCKYTDFRCQLFYWRRPSSACQAYEPPVTGSIMGGGIISTFDGRSMVFNDEGVYTLLHAHRTESTPEVQIQARLERLPDRSVNFARVEFNQDRVVPSNVTVVTGVVLSSEGADKVHVLLRKDTYRQRYRTTIMVGNVVRYFDNMVLQKFQGVTVYVNNVHKGQSEVYVVLDNAQIGVRIRESYALDMDSISQFFESPGMLDVQVSVPPQYKVHSPSHIHQQSRARVEGLLMPYSEQTTSYTFNGLLWTDVNSEGTRANMQRFKVGNIDQQAQNPNEDLQDLFVAQTVDEALYQSFPDHFLKGPVYSSAAKYKNTVRYPFTPFNEQLFRAFIDFCKKTVYSDYQPEWERERYRRCPKVESIEMQCQSDIACMFDATMLQSQLLGNEVQQLFHGYQAHRLEAVRHYNSCGAMNIEYPEYLIKGPSSADKAYLEGDTLQYSCYQTHVIYGDSAFTCQKVPIDSRYSDGEHDYTMRWTSGGQPWCRHRAKDNVLTWLQWLSIAIGIILVVVIIFACCWACKQKQKNAANQPKEFEMKPLNDSLLFDTPEPPRQPIRYIRKENPPASGGFEELNREPSNRSRHNSFSNLSQLPGSDYFPSKPPPKSYQPRAQPPSYGSRPSSRKNVNEITV